MKFSNEARVGIIGIATIAALIWGINYLKGRNIFNSTYTLCTFYTESGGLESSSPVLMKGIKIGYVQNLVLRTDETPAVKVTLNIEKHYSFGKGSVAKLASAGLLGTKVINIAPSGTQPELHDHDTIRGVLEPDLLSNLQSNLYPILEKAGLLATSLDSLSRQMELFISQDALSQMVKNLSNLTYSLKASLSSGGSLYESFENLHSFTGVLEQEKDEMSSLLRNLNTISESLNRAELDSLSVEMTTLLSQFNMLMEQVNSGEGSAGKLFYTDSLHTSLTILINNMDSLISNLKENPEDYVQISLFGKSKK